MRHKPGFIFKQWLQFTFTLVVVLFTIITIYLFWRIGNLSSGHKTIYLGLITALSLVLALKFFDAFKTLGRVAPPRLASLTGLSIKEFKDIEDWWKVVGLAGRHLCSRPWITLCCLIWICFFLAAQTTIALVNVEV